MNALKCDEHGSAELQLDILRRIIGPTEGKTFIDLCCGEMTVTRHLRFSESVHVDVVDEPRRPRHCTFVQADVTRWSDPIFFRNYDVAFCGDGIEHLSREDGLQLLRRMEICSALPIIFTPLGDYCVDKDATSPHQHRSGWRRENFPASWTVLEFPNWHQGLRGDDGKVLGALFAWISAPGTMP